MWLRISTAGLCFCLVGSGVFCLSSDTSIRAQDAAGTDLKQVNRRLPMRRKPLRICLVRDGKQLLVANRQSGSVSVVDTVAKQVTAEWRVGKEISEMIPWKDDLVLIADFQRHEIRCLDFSNDQPRLVWRCGCIKYPNVLALKAGRVFVGGLWSRQVASYPLNESCSSSYQLEPLAVLPVDFAVGAFCLEPSGHLVAFDAFGDRFCALASETLTQTVRGRDAFRRFGGVNINPATGEMVLSEQMLNHLAHAIRNDVHWGLMIANNLRSVAISRVLETPFRPWNELSSIPLGGAGDAKADPGRLSFRADGMASVVLGGVDEVAIGHLGDEGFAYVNVGRRPVDSVFSRHGKTLFVANYLDDSVSVVDVAEFRCTSEIPLGVKPDDSQRAAGESLFFDARLSHDGWMSCHSCHVDGHSNGFLNDNFSDQSFGAPKRVLSLLGHRGTEPFAWNGSAASLPIQISSSIQSTLQADKPVSDQQIDAIAEYINSLQPPPSLANARGYQAAEQQASISRGRQLFESLRCTECHSGEKLTSAQLYEVGLQDELGNTMFNPPSLIGVSQRDYLFHDRRAKSLSDVVHRFRHQIDRPLTATESADLLMYLKSL